MCKSVLFISKRVIIRMMIMIKMIMKIFLTRSNPKGIYTSWGITNNVTFT